MLAVIKYMLRNLLINVLLSAFSLITPPGLLTKEMIICVFSGLYYHLFVSSQSLIDYQCDRLETYHGEITPRFRLIGASFVFCTNLIATPLLVYLYAPSFNAVVCLILIIALAQTIIQTIVCLCLRQMSSRSGQTRPPRPAPWFPDTLDAILESRRLAANSPAHEPSRNLHQTTHHHTPEPSANLRQTTDDYRTSVPQPNAPSLQTALSQFQQDFTRLADSHPSFHHEMSQELDQTDLLCPIMLELIAEPMTIATAQANPPNRLEVVEPQYYERQAIIQVDKSPMTRCKILKKSAARKPYAQDLINFFKHKIHSAPESFQQVFKTLQNAVEQVAIHHELGRQANVFS